MQVAVTAAGGEVKKGINGSHIGIANDIELTNNGLNILNLIIKKISLIYQPLILMKLLLLSTIHLASNKINKIQGLNFKTGVSEIWGLQYHPEITYKKMVDIIKFRKDVLIEKRNIFKNEEEVNNHINFIEEEIKISEKDSRMLELRNWLNLIN